MPELDNGQVQNVPRFPWAPLSPERRNWLFLQGILRRAMRSDGLQHLQSWMAASKYLFVGAPDKPSGLKEPRDRFRGQRAAFLDSLTMEEFLRARACCNGSDAPSLHFSQKFKQSNRVPDAARRRC